MYSSARKNYTFIKYRKLLVVSVVIGFLSALLAISLKRMTEQYQEMFFQQAQHNWIYFILFPFFGLSLIYLLRQYLFKNKENKGIKEVLHSIMGKKTLPSYKIPSHFINGLITVSFGGSTGIEVSTVVSTAAIGTLAHEKETFFRKYKTELICAGITAGVTALFGSPFAGLLFAYEVISKKMSRTFLVTNIIAAAVAMAFVILIKEKPLFAINITKWHVHAMPYFLLLGILAGLHSVYLTRCVLFFKKQFSKFTNQYYRIIAGAAIISTLILILPQLYGDGYHSVKENILTANTVQLTLSFGLMLIGILVLKPIITSVTLAAGGDGGVFGPSIFLGAFLGLATAVVLNTFFDAGVIPINFMVIGMAAMLSATIHAPFTALFLICGLINDYTLFFPVLVVCLISKFIAKALYPYNVYTYSIK
ncbi:MAG: chloride channel protein [Flavobacterium sp.]|nr:MAG: chloride channel protein [Flavobacterium sp.]